MGSAREDSIEACDFTPILCRRNRGLAPRNISQEGEAAAAHGPRSGLDLHEAPDPDPHLPRPPLHDALGAHHPGPGKRLAHPVDRDIEMTLVHGEGAHQIDDVEPPLLALRQAGARGVLAPLARQEEERIKARSFSQRQDSVAVERVEAHVLLVTAHVEAEGERGDVIRS